MTKWVIIILLIVAGYLFYDYGVEFVSKVNTTVTKTNSSMDRNVNDVNKAIEYNNNH